LLEDIFKRVRDKKDELNYEIYQPGENTWVKDLDKGTPDN
jgi:hypothetical protein